MKFKTDENLGPGAAAALRDAGHDVESVRDESLGGAPDTTLAAHCAAEGRVLVSLDLDFANPLRFPPARSAGYAVIRLPARPTPADLQSAVAPRSRACSANWSRAGGGSRC